MRVYGIFRQPHTSIYVLLINYIQYQSNTKYLPLTFDFHTVIYIYIYYYIILYYIILYCIKLNYIILYCIILN